MTAASLAVCSWSLRPTDPNDLVTKIAACGLSAVQLHLDPLRDGSWSEHATTDTLARANIRLVSGMISMKGEDYSSLDAIKRTGGVRQDTLWGDNFRAAEANAALAQRLGLSLVTFHAGFLPHERGDALRRTMIDRVRQLAQLFAARGVRLALETGQESADTLLDVLAELNASLATRWHVGVNFDPANMILYGMGDPIDALRRLLPHVRQVHVKDALPTKTPGSWGEEVPVGTGRVDWPAFFALLREYPVPMAIEREAGEARVEDIRTAASLIRRLTGAMA
ncbi:MAG: hexulose-6-phosphate isomerase [Phycisphaerae bacterium]|nr:MAG: hexulose-6-phosphate isomerase [Phycisphaerae bacterium]